MIVEDEIIGSHTDETNESHEEETSVNDAYEAFGIEKPEVSDDETPAKEEVYAEPKVERVKHNKSEVEVDISTKEQLHDHLQRSLALDKERERRTEMEKNLDRAAKLVGYKDHADFVANFDAIEKQQQQREQDEHSRLIAELREQAEDAGLDPDQVERYLLTHPLVKDAERIRQERESEAVEKALEKSQQEKSSKWQSLYAKYPDLVESSKAFDEGKSPEWYTDDMKSRLERGYDPIDAYELAHRDKLTAQTKRNTEQRIIKETQLGLRSKVETTSDADNEPSIPANLANAFAAFGLPKEAAKKYVK